MPSNLYSAVNAFDKTQAKKVKEYFGILGLPVSQKTVNVPNRNGYVYVRLRDNESEIIQAYNEEVSPVWGLPVIIIRQGNGWRIKGRDVERYNDWGSDSSFLPAHHYQHEFNPSVPGGDVVFVYPQAFVPLLVTPSGTDGGPNVIMQSINFKKDNGDWLQAGVTGTSSLLVYKPTDGTAIVGLAYLNRDTGNPGFLINSGSAPAASVTGVHDLLQYLPDLPSDDYEPLAMVRMVSGTESLGWNNLYDIRQFFGGTATGTGGGGVEEAPIDGLVYGRKDADWVEVSGTSGGLPTLDANKIVITDGDGTITSDPHFEYDYVNHLLVIGSDYTKVPFAATNAAFVVGSGSSPSMGMIGYGEDIAPFYTFVRARGDWDTPLAVQNGDVIGRNRFRGHDGTTFPATRAEIRAQALGTWGTGSHGTEVVTSITPSGTTTMVDMLSVNQTGADLLYGTYNISGSPHTHPGAGLTQSVQSLIGSGTFSLSANYQYFVDISGLTGDTHTSFPAGSSGDVVDVFLTSGSANYALILEPSGSEWSRIFIKDEHVKFVKNSLGWQIDEDGRIACAAELENNNGQTFTNDTNVKVVLDELVSDNCSMADIINSRVLIRRTGNYLITCNLRFDQFMTAAGVAVGWIFENETTTLLLDEKYNIQNRRPTVLIVGNLYLTAGNYEYFYAYQNNGSTIGTYNAVGQRQFMSIKEIM